MVEPCGSGVNLFVRETSGSPFSLSGCGSVKNGARATSGSTAGPRLAQAGGQPTPPPPQPRTPTPVEPPLPAYQAPASQPTVPPLELARQSWESYAQTMISPEGLPLMVPGENYTTSEAVSYTLLQAAMLGDFKTFDKVLGWAEKHLQRSDKLFGWEWRKGRFTENGKDPASDADQDIAAALIIAWKKTGKATYKSKAANILSAVWQKEVVQLKNGKYILTAGPQQAMYLTDSEGRKAYGVNPSYFRPTYYAALFPQVLPGRPWHKLIDTSYEYIEKAADATMHGPQSGSADLNAQAIRGTKNLVPDFIAVRKDGSIADHIWIERQDFAFGGDAWRTLFWMSLQFDFNPVDLFAKRFMTEQSGTTKDAGPLSFLKQQVVAGKDLLSGYQINGEPMYDIEGLKQGQEWPWTERLWNAAIAYIYFKKAGEEAAAKQVMIRINSKFSFDQSRHEWKEADPYNRMAYYYGQTWMRFALLLDSLGARQLLDNK